MSLDHIPPSTPTFEEAQDFEDTDHTLLRILEASSPPSALAEWRKPQVSKGYRPPKPSEAFRLARYLHLHGNDVVRSHKAAFPKDQNKQPLSDGIHHARGYSWASHPHVRGALELLRRASLEQLVMSDREVIGALESIARADVRRMVGDDGEFLPATDWHPDDAAAVAGIEIEDGRVKRVKLWSKTEALNSLSRIKGLFSADNMQRAGSWVENMPRDRVKELRDALRRELGKGAEDAVTVENER